MLETMFDIATLQAQPVTNADCVVFCLSLLNPNPLDVKLETE
jgi:hypothetical protein